MPARRKLPAVNPEAVAAGVPKADLHVHQERSPRLDRILAAHEGREPLDWTRWMQRMTAETPAGMARLRRMQAHFPAPLTADEVPENVIARIADLLDEAARAGAWLVEPRFGNETVLQPDFFALLQAAQDRVLSDHRELCVAPVAAFKLGCSPEEADLMLSECLRAARNGLLAGVDLLCEPYDTEADWETSRRVARAAQHAGLGVTAHAGEFSTANLDAALALPGLTRIGHATHAARRPRLMDRLLEGRVTVECCLTSNVTLGAVRTLDEHPLPAFLYAGVPVALGTDDPVELCTAIDREYALAASLGLDAQQLTDLTRAAVRASFIAPERREYLLSRIEG
jgi:adenosine deaminase